jgi:hypothetical protein
MKEIMHIRIATILGFGILAASSARAQSVLASQPYANGNYTSSGPYTVYDDFSLAGGGSVTTVNWSGLDEGGLTGFTVSFWSDNGGLPGTLLTSDDIAGSAGETFSGSYDHEPRPIYNYSATLASPFSAARGTEYFLSIAGDTGINGNWCWEISGVGNSGILQYEAGFYNPIYWDNGMALTLEGNAVPEPGTIALGLFGASAFLFRRRK